MCSSRTHAHIKVVGARTASETNDMTIEDSICELFMSNGHIFAVLFAICVTKEAFHRKTSVSSCVCIVLDFFTHSRRFLFFTHPAPLKLLKLKTHVLAFEIFKSSKDFVCIRYCMIHSHTA